MRDVRAFPTGQRWEQENKIPVMRVKRKRKRVISVAYIDDDPAMREYGTHYLGNRAGYLIDSFATLTYGPEWFPFHTYDAIVLREGCGRPDLVRNLLAMLPYGDTTPVIVMGEYGTLFRLTDVLQLITARQPVFSVPLHKDPMAVFFELNQVIEMAVGRKKLLEGMQSLEVLLRWSGLSEEKQLNGRIENIVETCGRCMSAVFAAYLRAPERVGSPAAEWYAGECRLRYAPADYAVIPIRSRRIRRGRLSPGWTCSAEGRIEWAGKEGNFSVILYPVCRQECRTGVLSIVYPLTGMPAAHEILIVETCADLISWHEHLAARPAGEMSA
jgi:hypothetical protein